MRAPEWEAAGRPPDTQPPRFPVPLRALTQVTSGLCRNSSTSCDTVTSMLSRGRAAQSGSGSGRRARETKAGREPTVRGCGPARPGRARGWGRGGGRRSDAVPPRSPGALRSLAKPSRTGRGARGGAGPGAGRGHSTWRPECAGRCSLRAQTWAREEEARCYPQAAGLRTGASALPTPRLLPSRSSFRMLAPRVCAPAMALPSIHHSTPWRRASPGRSAQRQL